MNRGRELYRDPKQWIWWGIPVVVVVAIAVALYYGRAREAVEPEQIVEQAPVTEAEPGIQYPVAEAPADEPLPALNESDEPVQESLAATFGRSVQDFIVPNNLIRHFVVTVDNLPRKKAAVQMWPVKPMAGEFQANRTEADELVLSSGNYTRYAPIVTLLQSANTEQVGALYRRFYPLFQQAYVDLGYPDGYFNDRLVEVIDHLLETPDVQGPIRLAHPTVRYHFADPQLEERSAGQKTLIRMGPQNAATVKAKLRELRREVAKQGEDRSGQEDRSG